MKIDYVISTMVFWWREHHLSFEMECDFLKSLGFGVEIWPTIKGHSECRFIERNWSRLKDATEGMKVVLHGRVDGPTLSDWEEQLDCAKLLDAPITTHLESLCISDTLDIADWDFAGEVVRMAKDKGVTLCIENGKAKHILEIGNKFDSIYYCFNTGHAYLDREQDYKKSVDEMASRMKIVHLTDNFGVRDDHLPPGSKFGMPEENWEYLLGALEKNGNEVIGAFEMYPPMPGAMIKSAEDFIFDKIKWPNKPKKTEDYEKRHYRPY